MPPLVPAPNGRAGKTFSTYVHAELFHASGDLEWRSKSIKTQHSMEKGADVIWRSQFEWEYENDEMAFLRYIQTLSYVSKLIYSLARLLIKEDEFGRDDHIVVFCGRLEHIVKGKWLLVRMMDMKGKNSGATVLARLTSSRVQ
jgi:phosphatidylinositol phospholipase C delta